nr:ATP-binding protein [Xanthobacter sp. 126]
MQNFMRIDERVDVDLGPVTVLVGANGSGKSSILKAIHWAVRCATLRDHNNNTSLEQMDYTPSRDFLQLGHKRRLQNREEMPKICVGFIDQNDQETIIQISAARNDAGAKAPISGPLSSVLTAETPQTAYIPGLAGLAETETLLATPILHRRAASGEGGSVLRHILLELAGGSTGTGKDYVPLTELAGWVGKVIPGVEFWVKFDRLRDVNIDAQFLTPDMAIPGRSISQQRRPLEMAGTGFLQIVQIFACLLKFKPRLLLIDEPDAHLHPGTQELLIKAIEEATLEFPDTQFVLTTHSPSMIRACGEKTKVRWMDKGSMRTESERMIRQRMGWGALDKELILFTEDEDISYMNSLLSQWPEIERKCLVWSTFGSAGLPHGDALLKLRDSLGVSVLVHRDRDFMSDRDIEGWMQKRGYISGDIPVWLPDGSDIESAFCNPEHISKVMNITPDESAEIIHDALQSLDADRVESLFNLALMGAVSLLPATERSVPSARWREMGEYCPRTIKGKIFLDAIKNSIKQKYRGTTESIKLSNLNKISTPQPGRTLEPSLQDALRRALQRESSS